MTKFRSIISVLAMCGIMWLTVQVTIVWLEYRNFPSSEVGVDSSAPAFILPSIMDVQRELNRRGYKLKVDGLCGPATQAAWDAECGNQYAIEFMFEEIR